MTARKFYYREFRIRVVSTEPVTSIDDLVRVVRDEQLGVWGSQEGVTLTKAKLLNGKATADLLKDLGAEPDLFSLDGQGNDDDEA